MAGFSRRQFLQGLAAGALSLNGCQAFNVKTAQPHVLIVGGGFGGATVAKTLRQLDSAIKVTLIEPKARYITCPGSNWLFAGLTGLEQLTVDYRVLQERYGVKLLQESVAAIEPERRQLVLAHGQRLSYDRLILSPGISFRWDAIAGYDKAMAEVFPHAWQAGPQTALLARQLQTMPDNGVVLIAPPADPYRCPPGPYERASMMAYWLKQYKPRAKILIVDPKRSFSKQALFEAGWAKYFGYGTSHSLIEWYSVADNPITELDQSGKTVITEFGDKFSADVLNIIPPQAAAEIAGQSGLTDASGWCPVYPATSQSLYDDYIHVIGDAAHYAPIPKSAFAANSEAKACAAAVAGLLNEQLMRKPHWLNTCYSLITPTHGISVAGVYRLNAKGVITAAAGAGGVSHSALENAAALEAGYTRAVYRAVVGDSFGIF